MEPDEKICPQCAETIKAEARVCRFCGFQQSGSSAPVAKAKRKASPGKAIGCLAAVILGAVVFTCTQQLTQPGSPLASSPLGVDTKMQEIRDKVADDAVKQYNIAVSGGGSAIDRCAQAGMVAAAFLQAQNQPEYASWKATEKTDCAAAGIRK